MARMKRRSPAGRDASLVDLAVKLGHAFHDPDLLDQALTHRSRAFERKLPERHNERMEFLGDAILGFIVGERLYAASGGTGKVGALSRRRADLVSAPALAARARAIGLGDHLRLGKGEEASGGREKESILADALESVVAAIYLDGGLRAARAFVLRLFDAAIAAQPAGAADPRSELQEILQARGLPVPAYRVVRESGSAQAPSFTVAVVSQGEVIGEGEGRTKKAASAEAARAALSVIRGAPPGSR